MLDPRGSRPYLRLTKQSPCYAIHRRGYALPSQHIRLLCRSIARAQACCPIPLDGVAFLRIACALRYDTLPSRCFTTQCPCETVLYLGQTWLPVTAASHHPPSHSYTAAKLTIALALPWRALPLLCSTELYPCHTCLRVAGAPPSYTAGGHLLSRLCPRSAILYPGHGHASLCRSVTSRNPCWSYRSLRLSPGVVFRPEAGRAWG